MPSNVLYTDPDTIIGNPDVTHSVTLHSDPFRFYTFRPIPLLCILREWVYPKYNVACQWQAFKHYLAKKAILQKSRDIFANKRAKWH